MATAPKIDTSDEAFRASVVGASEVAALFDASPWLTHFELWHRKNGTIATPDFNAVGASGLPEDMRVFCGVMLEKAVIEIACKLWGYKPANTPGRLDNGKGLGGHPDILVECPERGLGVLEVKTADWLIAKGWGDEPPLNYQLQAQTYAGLAKVGWCDIITLVGGNDPRRFQMAARPLLFAEIEKRVSAFWESVRAGTAPKPDYSRDGDALVQSIGAPDDSVADLRENLDAEQDAIDFMAGKALRDRGQAQMDVAKAKLIERIGAAGRALLPGHKIGCNQTKDSPGTLITAEMIGTHVGARKGYRRFDVKEVA